MKKQALNPLNWNAPRLNIPAHGAHVCELKFSLDIVPGDADMRSCGYAFHAVFLNDNFIGSDEFSLVTEYNISDKLKIGENVLKVLLIPNQADGWFSIDSDSLPQISTASNDWKWLENDPLLQNEIVPCMRALADSPWDGGGQRFNDVPIKQQLPAGVVNSAYIEPNTMFPTGCAVVKYEEGDSVPFEGNVVFDFGVETLGYVELEIESDNDCIVILRFAESFDRLDSYLWFHADDIFRIKRGRNRIFDPSRKGFRYLQLTANKAGRLRVTKVINFKPGREFKNRGFFKCSDEFLNKVNEVSCCTVELCSQKFLEDGIKRDRLCWTGDLRPMALVMYNQLGETSIVRDSLYAFAHHINEFGAIQPAYPWRTGWVMADYVMWWIISLWEYFEYSGDFETLCELAPIAIFQEEWLRTKCDDRGLIITKSEDGAPITCWSSRSRDGFTSYHNALWYYAKKCLQNIKSTANLDACSDAGCEYGNKTKGAAAQQLRDLFVDSNGLWRDLDFDGNFRPEIPHDGTITALFSRIISADLDYFELGSDSLAKRSLESCKRSWTEYGAPLWWPSGEREPDEKDNRIMPIYNAYEAEQRIRFGDWAGAMELLRRCYGHMLDLGSTTFWECIQMDGMPDILTGQKAGFTSLCHGWSGYPAAFLPTILGYNASYGKEKIRLTPYSPASCKLEYAEANIPVNDEQISLRIDWDPKLKLWRYCGMLPEGFSGSITTGFTQGEVDKIETSNCSIVDGGKLLSLNQVKGGEEFEVAIKCKESYQQ